MLQNLSFFDLRETSISLWVLTHAAVLQEIDDNWIEIILKSTYLVWVKSVPMLNLNQYSVHKLVLEFSLFPNAN